MQDSDGGDSGFVVVNLGVGDARVVIDDGVHERIPELGVAPLVLRLAGSDGTIPRSLTSPDVSPAPTVGDVPEVLDVHVHERARVVVFVSADHRLASKVAVDPPLHGRPRHLEAGSDFADRPSFLDDEACDS
jgi:hypothetical protein